MKKILAFVLLFAISLGNAPRKITLLALGDSITYLNDHLNQTGNRLTKGYLTRITENNPRINYINKGYNGWTSVKVAQNIDSLGLTKAEVYTVFLGTNDWWQGKVVGKISDYEQNTGTGTVYGSFKIITDKLRRLNRKAKIILITPMQRGDFVYLTNYKNNAYGSYKPKNGQALEEFANAVVAIGRLEKFPVVDLYHDSGMTSANAVRFKRLRNPQLGEYQNYPYPEYTEIPFDPEKDEYPYPPEAIAMTYDGLHPSDKGNEIIAEMLIKKWKGFR
ncbi:SGNH/GDSL hydrolase family protein [Persicitalea sp.]|uniref:SGNH/GDSL hydrolase family protein n=1 Tax=Persicitalea sp. TaxID=3100273 RepID=UPI00359370B3